MRVHTKSSTLIISLDNNVLIGEVQKTPVSLPSSSSFTPIHSRGPEGGGGDRGPAPEQPHPPGELPEADGAAERPGGRGEPHLLRTGECSDRPSPQDGAEDPGRDLSTVYSFIVIVIIAFGIHV